MSGKLQRMMALLLAAALTFSVCPVVHAEEENTELTTQVEDQSTESAPVEETAPTEETVTEETTITEQTAATEQPEQAPALPYGLTGMPADYALDQVALDEKKALADSAAKLIELVPNEDYVEGEVLAQASSEQEAALLAAAFNGTVKRYQYELVTVTLEDCTVLEAVTAAADVNNTLPAVYPNYLTKNDPVRVKNNKSVYDELPQQSTWESWVQYAMDNPDKYLLRPHSAAAELWEVSGEGYQWHHDAIDTYGAWGVSTGEGVTVAVIDSGVDASHEDLGQRVVAKNVGYGTTPVDSHATHVAGIIAAEGNNGIGGVGVAPTANILSYCAADSMGRYSDDMVYTAIYDAVNSGAWIINMSFGGTSYNPLLQQAINYAYRNNVTCIAAMGNTGSSTMLYPAAFDHVIAVTATDQSNARARYSTYGSWSDVSAPGSDIISTVPWGDYDKMNGTSMAAPVVSGMAALYMASVGHVSPDTMEKVLEKSMVNGVVNAAKMFSTEKSVPEYLIKTSSGYYLQSYFGKNAIPCNSELRFGAPTYDHLDALVYTTDGTTPRVKDGQIINGQRYTGESIDLSQFAGKTVTVKAVRITGMGVVGKTLTLKLKIALSDQVTGVSITGSDTLVAGKYATFKATVDAPDAVKQTVTWSIVSRSSEMSGAKIDKNGKLRTTKGCEGYVIIRAKSTVNPSYYCDKRVEVREMNPVYKITPSAKRISVGAGYTTNFTYELLDSKGNKIDPTVSGVELVSSKTSVMQVSSTGAGKGRIIGLKKGTATLTIKPLDGSGRTATVSITVTQPVEELTISGQKSIAPGASATYKTTAAPSTSSNKKVTWELVGAPAGVTITTKGTVKVASSVAAGKTFTVRARAADGYGATATYQVTTARKASKIQVKHLNTSGSDNRPVIKNGSITSVELYTVNRPNNPGYDETYIALYGIGDNNQYGSWTSSSSAVTIYSTGNYCVVQANKPGTARLTCTMQDGSGRKATVTVKVTTPASRLNITCATAFPGSDKPYVAIGRTMKFKATQGNDYGKPSNTKLTWSVRVYGCLSNGEINPYSELTSTLISKRLISISNGTLSVKKGVSNYWGMYGLRAIIHCEDAYGNYDKTEAYIVPATTRITTGAKTVALKADNKYNMYTIEFSSDQWCPGYDLQNHGFQATSSNSKLVGVQSIVPATDRYGNVIRGRYLLVIAVGRTGVKGRATITIKALDSGKTAKITANVK